MRVSAKEFSSICDRLPRCSWAYNYTTSELQISMPTAIHRVPAEALNFLFFRDVYEVGLLTADEKEQVRVGAMRSVLLEELDGGISSGEEPGAVEKMPDWSWLIRHPTDEAFPTMVMEVGFSQDAHNLRRDQYRWIKGSDGDVKCVILIDIVEDTEHRHAHRAHFQEYSYPASFILRNGSF